MSSYSELTYGPTLSWHATWAIEHVKSPKRLNGKIDVVAYWRNSKLTRSSCFESTNWSSLLWDVSLSSEHVKSAKGQKCMKLSGHQHVVASLYLKPTLSFKPTLSWSTVKSIWASQIIWKLQRFEKLFELNLQKHTWLPSGSHIFLYKRTQDFYQWGRNMGGEEMRKF